MFTLEKTPDYDFDIIAFWADKDGIVYYGTDSGCSCPCPFEDCTFEDIKGFKQEMERVENIESATALIKNWRESIYSKADRPNIGDLTELMEMFSSSN